MKHALITGASKGIGRAIAQELAARGVHVVLVARDRFLLEELAVELKATHKIDARYFAVDLASADAIAQVYHWISEQQIQIHILVNNAGYGLSGPFESYTAAEHEEMMRVNMNVPVALTSAFLPHLKIL